MSAARKPAGSAQSCVSKAALDSLPNLSRFFERRKARAILGLLIPYLLLVTPGFSEATPLPTQALFKQIQLVSTGPLPVRAGLFTLSQQIGPHWRGGVVELFASIPPERSAVPHKQTDQESKERQPRTLEQLYKDHPVISNVLLAIVTGIVGFAIGGGFGGGK